MKLDVITPEKTIYSSELATSVICPGIDGDFQIMNSHAPLVSALRKGKVIIQDTETGKVELEIKSGLIECASNKVNILVEEA